MEELEEELMRVQAGAAAAYAARVQVCTSPHQALLIAAVHMSCLYLAWMTSCLPFLPRLAAARALC